MHVHHQVPLQVLPFLGSAPGSAVQPVDIGPQHGKGVVDGKERIMLQLFKLSQSPLTASCTLVGFMNRSFHSQNLSGPVFDSH